MDRIIASTLLIFTTDFFIESVPIKSGFSVKFKPLLNREEVHPKTFGALFAKISQEYTPEAILRRELFAKSFQPPSPQLGAGCSNQVARMMYPMRYSDNNSIDSVWNGDNFINLPIIQQPYKDYKILVVTAPPDVKIGRTEDDKKVVIYVVFSEDGMTTMEDAETSSMVTIPEVYFVNKPLDHNLIVEEKKEVKPDPMILIDNNRTVTGIKSKHVEKVLKFKNNLLRRYNYELTP